MKRAFTAVTFALAMVALNGARPTEISAQEAAVRELRSFTTVKALRPGGI